MTIAVYIPSQEDKDPCPGFARQVFVELAALNRAHQFIFLSDEATDQPLTSNGNVTRITVKPAMRNRLLQHYVFNFKIPRILTRYNVDWFISSTVCSLRTKKNQLLIVPDLAFLKTDSSVSKADRAYLKRFGHSFLRKASGILLLNNSLRPLLETKFHILPARIHHTPWAFSRETGRDAVQREKIKDELTAGSEYFLAFVNDHSERHLLTVIKAFSIFKKWQKSSMQLVVVFDFSATAKTVPGLSSYKYREDVKLIDAATHSRYQEILSSAYALIYLSRTENLRGAGVHLFKSQYPMIVSATAFNQDFYGDAVFYSAANEKALSDRMMLVYKDEAARQRTLNTAADFLAKNNAVTVAQNISRVLGIG